MPTYKWEIVRSLNDMYCVLRDGKYMGAFETIFAAQDYIKASVKQLEAM